uniref:Uncharacterized protein n=1 Tax=Triticum urartu TaxID=4572 RepID=A0A8R7REZ6_TRIUA
MCGDGACGAWLDLRWAVADLVVDMWVVVLGHAVEEDEAEEEGGEDEDGGGGEDEGEDGVDEGVGEGEEEEEAEEERVAVEEGWHPLNLLILVHGTGTTAGRPPAHPMSSQHEHGG